MAFLPDDAIDELLQLYGESELEQVRRLIGSSTLRDAARLIVESQAGLATIFIPHYWAEFYHDGRDGFEAPSGHFLVYFADPDDDPRISGGYPVRESDVRHLSREEFYAGLARNTEAAEAGGTPFMFVVRSVGPADGHPFFDELAQGAAARMDQFASFALDAYVQENLDSEGGQKSTARVKL